MTTFHQKVKLLFVSLLWVGAQVLAQIPASLANIKASQISDTQLKSYISQGQSAGLSQDQIEAEMRRRGLPETELAELRSRIMALMSGGVGAGTTGGGGAVVAGADNVRGASPVVIERPALPATQVGGLPVFGGGLFRNGDIRFEPDSRMATPASYILGPEDVLNIDISGVNDRTQKLKVSPEGTIRLSYVGEVFVSGLTINDATERIRSRMAKVYPQLGGGTKLSVSLSSIRSIRVMVIGEVAKPSVYTLSSLATVFHALYACGGPEAGGSLRQIELIRGNRVVETIDIYKFLLQGDQGQNIRLHDNDVIRVPLATCQVSFMGGVKRNNVFEMLPGEKLNDLLVYAGGFKEDAFKALVQAERFNSKEKEVIDIPEAQYANHILQNGDRYSVGYILDRFSNRIKLSGAVFRPGLFEYEQGLTVKKLIEKADGLREDAYRGRALLYRMKEDRSREITSINLEDLYAGLVADLALRKDDELVINSIFDFRTNKQVGINGAVKSPGSFAYTEGLHLKQLIQMAGGFAEFPSIENIEIARRMARVNPQDPNAILSETITVKMDTTDLKSADNEIALQPYDIVTIRQNPFAKGQMSVSISGEVLYPGNFTMATRTERLSQLYQRSGGKLADGNLTGAKLIRRRENLSSADQVLISRISLQQKDSTGKLAAEALADRIPLAINLVAALANPNGVDDILLAPGDELQIPRFDPTVQVVGEVLKPIAVGFEGRHLRKYINAAGGYLRSADRRKVFVVYANGKAARTKGIWLFFKKYPRVEMGSQVMVPREYVKPAKANAASTAVTASVLASLATVIIALTQILK